MDIIKPYKFIPKEKIERQATKLRMSMEGKRKNRLKAKDVAEAIADSLDLSIEVKLLQIRKIGVFLSTAIISTFC